MLSARLEWQLAKLQEKLKKGEIVDEVYQLVRQRLEEQAESETNQRPSTIWQQEQDLAEEIENAQRKRHRPVHRPAREKISKPDPLAGLIAMRANGEISAEEFALGRELLSSDDRSRKADGKADVNPFTMQTQSEIATIGPTRGATGKRLALTGFAVIMTFGLIALIEKGVSRRADSMTDTASSVPFEDKCVSSWNGSVKSFESVVRTALGNPTGFTVVRTGFGSTQGRIVTMTMEYTVTTGIGGKLSGKALGKIDSATCETVGLDAI